MLLTTYLEDYPAVQMQESFQIEIGDLDSNLDMISYDGPHIYGGSLSDTVLTELAMSVLTEDAVGGGYITDPFAASIANYRWTIPFATPIFAFMGFNQGFAGSFFWQLEIVDPVYPE